MGQGTTKLRKEWLLAAGLLLASPWAWAMDLAPLRAQFDLADSQVDYANAKLVVDQLIDPTTDTAVVRRELYRWEKAVRSNFPVGAGERTRLDTLIKTLYEPGIWNQGKPFSYDLDDPMGRIPENKRLATYLSTRKGNCVSMPILVVILGQRLGLPVALATAPNHVMVKFADDTQQAWVNVEATGGGFKYDSSYARDTGITPLAIESDLYLRPLQPREGVGVIASSLMEYFGARKDGDGLMEVADLALAANPRDPVAMIWKANAFYLQLQEQYVRKYPDAADIPADRVADYRRLSQENLAWFDRAEKLGWVQQSPQQEAAYLQSIQQERTNRGQ